MQDNQQFRLEMEKLPDDFIVKCKEQLQNCSLSDEAYSASIALAFVIRDTFKQLVEILEQNQ